MIALPQASYIFEVEMRHSYQQGNVTSPNAAAGTI